LLHDFGGCETSAVLEALGRSMSDVFERPLGHHCAPSHSSIPARERLELIDHEVTVAALIVADMVKERTADQEQWERLAQACARIGKARDHGRA
jgi:hypothetical protein